MKTRPSVVFLNRFYPPDVAATGQLLGDLAGDLAARGWTVTVICGRGPYRSPPPAGQAAAEDGAVRVRRVGAGNRARDGARHRILDAARFHLAAFRCLVRLPRPDAIVAMTDPPLLVAPALLAGRLRGVPVVHWVQDLYPQIAGRLGVLPTTGRVYRFLARVGAACHRACHTVVTLGPGMTRAAIAAGAPPDRTVDIPNWADTGAIRPLPRDANPFVAEHGLADKFVVLYSGNAGRAHTFDAVLGAARRLRDRADIIFLFIGGGHHWPGIRRTAETERLANIRFLPYLPRERLAQSLSAASVALITENPLAAGLVVPSKLYGILASARPVVFVGPEASDIAAVVRRARCGLVIAPDDAEGLANALVRLKDSPAEAAAMGARARRLAEESYDRAHAASSWNALLNGLVAGRRPAPARRRILPRERWTQ